MHSLSVRRKDSNFSFMGKKFCIYPLTTLNVTVPQITPCCSSMLRDEVHALVSYEYRTPLVLVWNSDTWKWWRDKIASDNYEFCDKCSQKSDFVTEDELRAIDPAVAEEVIRFRNGDRTALASPSTMVLSFDHSCNLRCVTCRPSDKPLSKWHLDMLSDSVLSYVRKMKRVVIAGDGEVAVSPIYRKVLSAVDGDTKITLMSNGTLLGMDFWGSLDERVLRHIDRVHISCDGTTKDVYESIRLHGSFDRWLDHMAVLMGLKAQYGWTTKLMYTVSKDNYADFRNVGEFAHRIGFDELYIGVAAPWCRPTDDGIWMTDKVLGRYEQRLVGVVAKRMMEEYRQK